MPKLFRALLLAAALGWAACGNGTPPAVPGAQLPVDWLTVGGHRITVELARRPAERSRGLMFRESLPPDHGMLFVFPRDEVQTVLDAQHDDPALDRLRGCAAGGSCGSPISSRSTSARSRASGPRAMRSR